MNGVRGEAAVIPGDARRRACLTLGALAEIETGLGVDGMAAVAERMKTLSARDLMIVLAAVLRGGGEVEPKVAAVVEGVADVDAGAARHGAARARRAGAIDEGLAGWRMSSGGTGSIRSR
jgi:hypothetical protein